MFMWLANALCNKGHDVTVMTFMPNDEVSLDERIHWIKSDELKNNGIFSKIWHIRKEIKRVNPDVSISFLLDANVYNIFACLGLKVKSVVCERNDPFKPGYKVLKFWKPWFRFAKGAVFQLPKVAKYYSNIKAPTAVIPNPVLSKSEYNVGSFCDRPNVINVLGRLDVFQKRHDLMIDAFAKFVKDYPEFKLVFYGDGPDKDNMQKQIDNNGISGSVSFGGITLEPLKVMAQSKMFVLTSDFEGIPNSLIEAMSLGLPCISTDCRPGGAKLVIENGVSGFIVPQGDIDSIADKMKWYMQHPTDADTFGCTGMKIKEMFSEDKVVNLWESYLKKLCN